METIPFSYAYVAPGLLHCLCLCLGLCLCHSVNHNGLGIKHGLIYKTRTVAGYKYGLRTTVRVYTDRSKLILISKWETSYKWEQTIAYVRALRSIHLFSPLLEGGRFPSAGTNCSCSENKWVSLGKTGHTWKNRSHVEKWSHLKKWVTVGKVCDIWKMSPTS